MSGRLSVASILALIFITVSAAAVSAQDYPNVKGVWTGTYKTAFLKGGKVLDGEDHGAQMELDVFKQDTNLIWAKIRWRVKANREWNEEHTTGTFDLLEPTKLNIVQLPQNDDLRDAGFYEGHVKDGKMYLTFKGVGNGLSFAVMLERK